jgi:hypothetical protein
MANFGWVEDHPYITGGVVIGGGLLLWLYWSGSSSGSSAGTASTSASTTSGVVAADPNVQAAQVQLSSQSSAAQVAALQSSNQTLAEDTGYGDSASVAITQANDTLAANLASTSYGEYTVGAQQQVANAQTQATIQSQEIAAGLPLTYTMAAGGPFSALYAETGAVGTASIPSGGTVPTNNPTSAPSQTLNLTGSNGGGSAPLLGSVPSSIGVPYNYYNPSVEQNVQAPNQYGEVFGQVLINSNNPSEGYTTALLGGQAPQ